MHKLIAPCALALMSMPAGAATRGYIITDFDSLRVEAPIDIVIETGRGISVRGEGDTDMLGRIDLAVSARMLTIRLKQSPFSSRRDREGGPVKLVVTVPTLRRIQLSGSGSIKAKGLDKLRAELISAGSGSMMIVDIASDNLSVGQLGSGAITLSGAAKSVTMRVSGSGSLDGKSLRASDLDVTLDGSASVEATADRAAKITAIGPGNVVVTGKGGCTVRHAGSGEVRCGGELY